MKRFSQPSKKLKKQKQKKRTEAQSSRYQNDTKTAWVTTVCWYHSWHLEEVDYDLIFLLNDISYSPLCCSWMFLSRCDTVWFVYSIIILPMYTNLVIAWFFSTIKEKRQEKHSPWRLAIGLWAPTCTSSMYHLPNF